MIISKKKHLVIRMPKKVQKYSKTIAIQLECLFL